MASYTYDQLREMTVAELRVIADGIKDPSLEGHSTMHKDHLLPALCKVLNIPTHHVAAGSQKSQMKAQIRKLKAMRDNPSGEKRPQPADIRHNIHLLKRKLRRMA